MPSIWVISLVQLAVEPKPGSYVQMPVLHGPSHLEHNLDSVQDVSFFGLHHKLGIPFHFEKVSLVKEFKFKQLVWTFKINHVFDKIEQMKQWEAIICNRTEHVEFGYQGRAPHSHPAHHPQHISANMP